MSNAPVVTVADPFNHLLKHTFGLSFCKSFVWLRFEISVKRAARHILHYDNHLLASVNYFVKSDYVLAKHLLHQFNLPAHRFAAILIHQFVFLVDFHSHLFICWLMKPNTHHCVGYLTNLLSNYVVIEH